MNNKFCDIAMAGKNAWIRNKENILNNRRLQPYFYKNIFIIFNGYENVMK